MRICHHVTVVWEGWRHERPARIADHDGRQWTVRQVFDHWTHPDHHSRETKVPYGIEAQRWRLIVAGPLPHRPGQAGEQCVALRTYSNDGAGWYLIVDQAEGEGRPGNVSTTSAHREQRNGRWR
jgi:hypothetical protein